VVDRFEQDTIVLVGSETDDHVEALREALRARGATPVVLDSLKFPDGPKVSLGPGPDEVTVDGRKLGRPGAVYLRSLYLSPLAFGVDVQKEMDEDWRTTLVVFREKAEVLLSVLRRWEERGVPIYNPVTASDAVRKPYQVSLLAAAGLPVPETLWTNDAEAVRRFASGRRVAYKPVAGGAATRELGPEDLDERRLATLSNAPVTFQELLPGTDIRVFILDGEIVAAYRIETRSLDYRQHEERVEPIELAPDVASICLRAADVTKLRFTGMDLKAAADGRLRILELNPSPMFLGFDRLAGTDVLGRLAGALIARARGQ
jgi:glutathione synthase/RimK-type ligase-like ATP-grasp enzyme